jgi:DNA-binding PadR family transcriptional regulator
MLILKTLALQPMHGYGVALHLEQISQGVFRINPGSLLPALSRMERAGRVRAEWRETRMGVKQNTTHSRLAGSGLCRQNRTNGNGK